MKILIECSSSLKKFLNVNELNLEETRELSIREIIEICNIPDDEVGFVTVNGKKEGFDYLVSESDNIKLFPTIIAG